MHYGTDAYPLIWDDRSIMLSTIGFFVVLSTAIFVYRARTTRTAYAADLGRMSTVWIAEHRASRSS